MITRPGPPYRRTRTRADKTLGDSRGDWFTLRVKLPSTLLYCFDERDEILLLERAQEPNRGFWSPCGGKLKTDIGESPYVSGLL